MKVNGNRGITLIALIITIIILLILAGISIATLTGENGILKKASSAGEQTKIAEYKEILIIIGNGLRSEKILEDLSTKEYMDRYQGAVEKEIEKGDTLEGTEVERKSDETIKVTTKEEYVYIVTEDEVKYLGKQGENLPPALQENDIELKLTPSGYTNGNVEVEIIARIELENNKLQYSTDGINWTNYTEKIIVKENGTIYARLINELDATGGSATKNITTIDRTNPNVATISFNVNTIVARESVIATVTQSDNLSGVDIKNCRYAFTTSNTAIGTNEFSKYNGGGFTEETGDKLTLIGPRAGNYYLHVLTVDNAGNKRETISGKVTVEFNSNVESLMQGVESLDTAGIYTMKVKEVTYNVHMYYYNGNQTWTGTKTFGDSSDVGTASTNANRMVVVKVNGNLTINSGAIVQPYFTDYGGPKGFLIYCTGILTNDGTIANNHGAKAVGENVYLWKSSKGAYQTVDAIGGAGATSVTASGYYTGLAGLTGGAGTNRKTGGGGSGASATYNTNTWSSGIGGVGTSYSGGPGGARYLRFL